MGLKALDPAIVEIAVILPALPGVFSNRVARDSSHPKGSSKRSVRARDPLTSAAYLRSERRTAACNSRSTNEQMLAETRPHSE